MKGTIVFQSRPKSENSRVINQDSLWRARARGQFLTAIPLNCRDRRKKTKQREETPGICTGSITEETTAQRDGGCTWSSERSVSREPTRLLLILSFFNSIPPPAPSFSLSLSLATAVAINIHIARGLVNWRSERRPYFSFPIAKLSLTRQLLSSRLIGSIFI